MRLLPSLPLAFLVSVSAAGAAQAQTFAMGRAPCKNVFATPFAQTPSQIAGLDLLGSLTQLDSKLGKPVLVSNFDTTVAINNQASPTARAQALKDALITDYNAFVLADGLGTTMAKIYQDKAIYGSDDGGRKTFCGEIGPAVSALIASANALSGGDSNAGKFGFANGMHGRYKLPPGGTFDVLGKAYGYPIDRLGADPFGNSRPFQTAPIDDASGPHIVTFDGTEFFGHQVNSRIMLRGSKDPAVVGSDLRENPSYPSGHTTFGYTESLLLALMVPERLQALAYRGSEYGDSRIVLGAHYAVDVIAGRTLATYDLAQNLAGTPNYATIGGKPFSTELTAAARELRTYLQTNGCPSISACAREPIVRAADAAIVTEGHVQAADPRRSYAFRLNYGLAPMGATDLPPEPVPEAAGFLLQTRFPYLTLAQRREVLRTTEGPSGHFLAVSPRDGQTLPVAGVYSRLDLFAAAGGYAAFADQVVVDQKLPIDPNLAPFADFAKADIWSNDISGPGGLTKRGPGALSLSGASTYAAPTRVEAGRLEIAGSIRAATEVKDGGTLGGTGRTGDVAVASGGTLAPGASDGTGALDVGGALTFAPGGRLSLHGGGTDAKLKVAGKTNIEGAVLILKEGGALKPGASLTIIEAKGGVSGTFAKVQALSQSLVANITYSAKAVYLQLDEAPKPKAKR